MVKWLKKYLKKYWWRLRRWMCMVECDVDVEHPEQKAIVKLYVKLFGMRLPTADIKFVDLMKNGEFDFRKLPPAHNYNFKYPDNWFNLMDEVRRKR